MAYERVTLYGVPLVADRLVNYGKVDRELSRELFIRHALVYGEWHTRHRFFAQEPRAARGGRGARAPRPAPRHRGRRAHALRLLRRPGRRRGGQRRALRPVVEAGAAGAARAAHLRPGDAHPRRPPRRCASRLPRGVAGRRGRADVPDQLPLRARRRRRRPDHRRAGRHAQPGRRRRLLLERARPARGAGHRPDPQPAQEPAGQLRAGARTRRASSSPRCRRARSRCSTRWSAGCARPPASSCRATPGTGPRCPSTCGRPTGSSTTAAPSRPAARTSRR